MKSDRWYMRVLPFPYNDIVYSRIQISVLSVDEQAVSPRIQSYDLKFSVIIIRYSHGSIGSIDGHYQGICRYGNYLPFYTP